MLNYLLLVSRPAMVEDAGILAIELQTRGAGVTVVLAGELAASERPDPDSGFGDARIMRDVGSGRTLPAVGLLARVGLFRFLLQAQRLRRRGQVIDGLLDKDRPDCLIVFDDRFIDPEALWLARAARVRIPAVLVRYALSTAESDAWTRRGRAAYSLDLGWLAWARRLFAGQYPAHMLDIGMGRQLFYSLWDSLALVMTAGMARAGNPWVVGGGALAAVAVQGQVDVAEAQQLCGPSGRFFVTGQPSWDAIARAAESRDRRRRQYLGDNEGMPLLVCALPQWAEHNQMGWPEHLELIEKLFDILGRCGCRVVLSLHPKADQTRYRAYAERHGLHIGREPLSLLLPAADIFMGSWSSTQRWAAILGIAMINLDWARHHYTLFAELRSMENSRAPDDLEPVLAALVNDQGRRERLGRALQEESLPYGRIDGMATQRVASLIEAAAQGSIGENYE